MQHFVDPQIQSGYLGDASALIVGLIKGANMPPSLDAGILGVGHDQRSSISGARAGQVAV